MNVYDDLMLNLRKQLNNLNKFFDNMNKLIVDGKSYDVKGTNVSVSRNIIKVNGVTIVDNIVSDTVHIKWEGDVANLDCTSCEITGNVQGKVNATSVKCGDVGGNIDATSVKCENVAGKIDAVSVTHKKD